MDTRLEKNDIQVCGNHTYGKLDGYNLNHRFLYLVVPAYLCKRWSNLANGNCGGNLGPSPSLLTIIPLSVSESGFLHRFCLSFSKAVASSRSNGANVCGALSQRHGRMHQEPSVVTRARLRERRGRLAEEQVIPKSVGYLEAHDDPGVGAGVT